MVRLPGKAKELKSALIQTVFFDIGGVLINIHPERTIQYWAERVGLDPEVVQKHFPEDDYYSYERGEINDHEFFSAFINSLPGSVEIHETDFWKGWKLLLGTENGSTTILKQLAQSYPVWLLSNTNPRHIRDELGRRVSFLDYIAGAVYSFDVGYRKPDVRIFHYALKKAGVQAQAALFIDDIKANVDAANELGLQVIHYRGDQALNTELTALGLLSE